MNRVSDIIILRGAPGVGKTELSKALAKHFPQGARVEVDALRKMVISVNWTDQAEHIKMLNLAAQTVVDFAQSGFCPVIVVDTFSGDKVEGFLKRVGSLSPGFVCRVFALHVAPEVLASRLATRPEGQFKDACIALKLNEDVLGIGHKGEVRVDTSNEPPEALAVCIKSNL